MDGTDGKAEATPSECFFVQELCEYRPACPTRGGGGKEGMWPALWQGSPCSTPSSTLTPRCRHPCTAPAGVGGSLGDLVRKQMIHNGVRRLYSDADALRWSIQVRATTGTAKLGLASAARLHVQWVRPCMPPGNVCRGCALADAPPGTSAPLDGRVRCRWRRR